MSKPITKEDILKYREEKRKEWIHVQCYEIVNLVDKYTKYNEDERDYSVVFSSKTIPKKYVNTRDEIYAGLKQHYPDCTVVVTIEKKNRLFWCIPTYELYIKVSWA